MLDTAYAGSEDAEAVTEIEFKTDATLVTSRPEKQQEDESDAAALIRSFSNSLITNEEFTE